MLSEMNHMTKCGSYRAGMKLPVSGTGHLFAFDTVLLGGEGEGHIGCCGELLHRASEDVKDVHGTNLKLDIF